MRLTDRQVNAIRVLLGQADPDGKIYLFGSRADDSKQDGDIDLFFETTIFLEMRARLQLEYRLSVACDSDVDLIVKTPRHAEQPIYAIARKGILL